MRLPRMDHVGIIVEDLDVMIRFFEELGLILEGRTQVSGDWAELVTGLPGLQTEIAMLRTPDGHNGIELSQFHTPRPVGSSVPKDRPHALGYRSIMFEVADIDGMVQRLTARGAELVGGIAVFAESYRLCYVRGPEDIIVALTERVE